MDESKEGELSSPWSKIVHKIMEQREELDMERERTKMKILQYLKRFPNAQDSLDGIARWWVQGNEREVEGALSELVEERILTKKECVYRTVYCLSSSKG